MNEDDIHELLSRVGERDERAFAMLHRQFAPRVLRFLRFRLRSADAGLADELLADTFWVVWQSPLAFDRSSKFSTWLLGIAHNRLLSALRAEHRRAAHETLDEVAEPCAESADPVEVISRREALLRCLPRLNADQAEFLYLVHVEGLSAREVAQVKQVPEGTVKSRVREAIARVMPCLRRALDRLATTTLKDAK
jgi:RNA polymerase sigma-70 factor (ECF subfamily)